MATPCLVRQRLGAALFLPTTLGVVRIIKEVSVEVIVIVVAIIVVFFIVMGFFISSSLTVSMSLPLFDSCDLQFQLQYV